MSTVTVNPEILRWARESAGLGPEEAVKKIGLTKTKSLTAVERLALLESGELAPSRSMLVKMAKQYRRPLLTFYLSGVPEKGDRGNDYRTLPEGYEPTDDVFLDALIRGIRARQSMLRAALDDEEEAVELPFIGSMSMDDGKAAVLASMRNTIPLGLDTFRAAANPDDAFKLLRTAVEKMGIYVVLAGNLGSYHTAIDLLTFRGFALSDDIAPFVVINDQDARAAWSFTLLHELTHLWLGQTGVSGGHAELAVEQFCNDVAGEFLLPAMELQKINLHDGANIVAVMESISVFANERNVSRSMVAYTLYRHRMITRNDWLGISRQFREEWLAGRESRRERARNQDSGVDYYTVRKHRLGDALVRVVRRMMSAGVLTTTKAGTVLGVKAKNVESLLSHFDSGRAA